MVNWTNMVAHLKLLGWSCSHVGFWRKKQESVHIHGAEKGKCWHLLPIWKFSFCYSFLRWWMLGSTIIPSYPRCKSLTLPCGSPDRSSPLLGWEWRTRTWSGNIASSPQRPDQSGGFHSGCVRFSAALSISLEGGSYSRDTATCWLSPTLQASGCTPEPPGMLARKRASQWRRSRHTHTHTPMTW